MVLDLLIGAALGHAVGSNGKKEVEYSAHELVNKLFFSIYQSDNNFKSAMNNRDRITKTADIFAPETNSLLRLTFEVISKEESENTNNE